MAKVDVAALAAEYLAEAETLKQRYEALAARVGGDEFVVLLRRVSSTEAALEKGNDICRKFREYSPAEGVHVTCSCGVVLCGPDEKPSLKLIDRADQALYRAKRENKGSCCLWKE